MLRTRGIRPPDPGPRISPALLCGLPGKLRAAQNIFGHTGGLHAAGLFDASGELAAVYEDIGRHNAVDKAVGWALLHDLVPLSEHILVVSGRGGFEIVQKAWRPECLYSLQCPRPPDWLSGWRANSVSPLSASCAGAGS